MIDWLKDYWFNLASGYTNDETSHVLWKALQTQYTSKNRYYHNLMHIYNMLIHFENYKTEIQDLDNVKFAIWYHDVIYNASKKNNEAQSAAYTEKVLSTINYNASNIKNIKDLIISTKKHELILTENNDNAYLLDLDLSILGSDWKTYKTYTENIRKEYKIYPDILYKPGRKKVLKHFLERETLYFTKPFQDEFEKQARANLIHEIKLL